MLVDLTQNSIRMATEGGGKAGVTGGDADPSSNAPEVEIDPAKKAKKVGPALMMIHCCN